MLPSCPNCASDIHTEMQLSPWKAQILGENGNKKISTIHQLPMPGFTGVLWRQLEMDAAGELDAGDANHLIPTDGEFKGELFLFVKLQTPYFCCLA